MDSPWLKFESRHHYLLYNTFWIYSWHVHQSGHFFETSERNSQNCDIFILNILKHVYFEVLTLHFNNFCWDLSNELRFTWFWSPHWLLNILHTSPNSQSGSWSQESLKCLPLILKVFPLQVFGMHCKRLESLGHSL